MTFSEQLVKDLESVIEDLLEKHEEDKLNAFGELLDEYQEELLQGFTELQKAREEEVDSFTVLEDSPSVPADSGIVINKLTEIKEDNRRILGTVSDLKVEFETFAVANSKAIEKVNTEHGKSAEEQSKKLEKLQKDAKRRSDDNSTIKKWVKRIGKFILGGVLLFLFGDLLKDLVVKGFDNLIHSDKLQAFIEKYFPDFAKSLNSFTKWWDEKAKPWLDTHSFAKMFNHIFTVVDNIYNGINRILVALKLKTPGQSESALDDVRYNVQKRRDDRATTDQIAIDPSKYEGIVSSETLRDLRKAYPDAVVARILAEEERFKQGDEDYNTYDVASGVRLRQPMTNLVANLADPYNTNILKPSWMSGVIPEDYVDKPDNFFNSPTALSSESHNIYAQTDPRGAQYFRDYYRTLKEANTADNFDDYRIESEHFKEQRQPNTSLSASTTIYQFLNYINNPAGNQCE